MLRTARAGQCRSLFEEPVINGSVMGGIECKYITNVSAFTFSVSTFVRTDFSH